MNRALPLLGLLLPVLAQAVTPDEAQLQQAVHEGRVRPFHEMMEVAARLPVRVLRVGVAHRAAADASAAATVTIKHQRTTVPRILQGRVRNCIAYSFNLHSGPAGVSSLSAIFAGSCAK